MAMPAASAVADPASGRRFHLAGALLGFALGGFFDGILLHQILQWHHLLSALEGEAFRDLRVQVLADGLFHLLMYVVAAVGLLLLWRGRRAFAAPGAGRPFLGDALLGFGLWHVLDAILSHWLLGIHRIRMDSPNPLAWDLLWFVVFGVLPLVAGLMLRRGGGGSLGGSGRAAPVLLGLAVLVAGPVAALPPSGATAVLVLVRPGIGPAQVFAAARAAGGTIVWNEPSGALWAIDLPEDASPWPFYARGALLVSRSLLPAGCLAWSRPA